MSGPDPEDEYFRSIEAEFLRRRGAPLLLSPRDWALVGEWRDLAIPQRLVIQAIGNVFDVFDRRPVKIPGRRINGLAYCRQEVLTLFELYCMLHAVESGRPASGQGTDAASTAPIASATPVIRHLGRLARQVGGAMRAASAAGRDALVPRLAKLAAEIKVVKHDLRDGTPTGASLESLLAGLDAALLDAIRETLPERDLQAIETEAATRLRDERARMTPPAWEATRAALVARLLRQNAGVPRLTLFD